MKSLSYYYDARLMCFIESEAILSGLDGAFWLEKRGCEMDPTFLLAALNHEIN